MPVEINPEPDPAERAAILAALAAEAEAGAEPPLPSGDPDEDQ